MLGLDWMRENKVIIDCGKNLVYIKWVSEEVDGVSGEADEERAEGAAESEGKVMILAAEEESRRRDIRKISENQRTDKKWGRIIRDIEERGITRQGARNYRIYAGMLFLEKLAARNSWVLCIPEEEVRNVLREFHDEKLHPGINKMQKMLGNLTTWKGMTKDIQQYVRSCHLCQISKSKPSMFSGPWQAIIPWDAGDLVAVDIFGPLVKSVYGYTCVLVVVQVYKVIRLEKSDLDHLP